MIQKAIAHIETTGQEVIGILRFETITTDAGWKLDDKGKLYWQPPKEKYLPIFKTYQRIEPFRGTSKVVVNNKFEFIAYSGVRCLIGTEAISKTPRRIGGLIMIITGMNHFQNVAKKKLVEWYHEHKPEVEIDLSNVFVVWSCKTLQNYKCLASTDISGDGIYAEYTYNGDKQVLYEDVYGKITNTCHTEE